MQQAEKTPTVQDVVLGITKQQSASSYSQAAQSLYNGSHSVEARKASSALRGSVQQASKHLLTSAATNKQSSSQSRFDTSATTKQSARVQSAQGTKSSTKQTYTTETTKKGFSNARLQEVHEIAESRRRERMKGLTRNLEVCDLLDMRNVQSVAEHAPRITNFLLEEEMRFMLPRDFM